MITLPEAQSRVLEGCPVLEPSRVPLDEALGCVLAETVTSPGAFPPFASSAMDGFAVRAEDLLGAGETTPVRLKVIGTLAAGRPPSLVIGPGEALRIMTGAVFPDGADTVAIVETTTTDGDEVAIGAYSPPGAHVRPAGDDIVAGQVLFEAGETVGPGHLGVLASIGRQWLLVGRRPTVAVISTGDELVEGAAALGPGQIHDSNRHSLLALVRQAGFDPLDLGVVADDEELIEAALLDGVAKADALVTSGGVSMGSFDYIKKVLGRIGRMDWMQVAIRPAKPLAFGLIGAKPVFGLPGNPVSSMVSFELFARPGLRKMMGFPADRLHRPWSEAVADQALAGATDGRVHFVRVAASYGDDGRLHIRPSGGQGSHMLWAMARANALAVVEPGRDVAAGESAPIIRLD